MVKTGDNTKQSNFGLVNMYKDFADNNLNVNQILKFALSGVDNIVAKGENAGYQHFLLLRQCIQKATFSGLLKVGWHCVVKR